MTAIPTERAVVLDGERRTLQPRVMQVLIALARARSAVVSRERLAELCWNGRVVGDDALNRCIVALRQLADHSTAKPFEIETVPRVGYRLTERPPEKLAAGAFPSRRLAAAMLAVVLLVTAGLWISGNSAAPGPASIAVAPFRNLSNGDPHFAEGIGEEIRGELAREPRFRVAGGASSRQLQDGGNARQIARALNVEYVLEGSVRRQDDRIRVNAELVKASSGVRLWSDSYDGSLDDVFAIQHRIGVAIATSLRRKLVRSAASSRPLTTNGDAYNLYLTSRGLMRTNNRRVGPTAGNLLRDAIKLDSGYAPAWASLAQATRLEGALSGYDGFVVATAQAERQARHALRLAPDHPEAHHTLGAILGFGTAEAEAHLRRAAALEPSNAENMIWLGVAQGAAGEFDEQLSSYRRAVELDPLWFRTVKQLAEAIAERGDRRGAESAARRGFPKDEISRNLVLARIASIFGDFSEAARRGSLVAKSNSPRWKENGRRFMNEAAAAAGLPGRPIVVVPPPNDQRRMALIPVDAPPSRLVWQTQNRDRIAREVYRDFNHKAAKLMLNAGRADELVRTYDGPGGLLGIRAGRPLRIDQLHETPVVALVLRRAGRTAEADRLLGQADRAARTAYRGRVPFWFDADTAARHAVQGRNAEALSLLEQVMKRGWTHSANTDLRDLADEPSFGSLRKEPRFRQLRARLAAHRAREQSEILRLQTAG